MLCGANSSPHVGRVEWRAACTPITRSWAGNGIVIVGVVIIPARIRGDRHNTVMRLGVVPPVTITEEAWGALRSTAGTPTCNRKLR